MISMDKEYRTRDGREVRVLCVDRKHAVYTVIGLITLNDGNEFLETFTRDGRNDTRVEHAADLIDVKPRIVRDIWINVYPDCTGFCRQSKEDADSAASNDRIACVKVTIDCEHGEGLNDKESQ